MIVGLIFIVIYTLIFLAAIVGIIYFIFKRIKEKKIEKEILDRDDY